MYEFLQNNTVSYKPMVPTTFFRRLDPPHSSRSSTKSSFIIIQVYLEQNKASHEVLYNNYAHDMRYFVIYP